MSALQYGHAFRGRRGAQPLQHTSRSWAFLRTRASLQNPQMSYSLNLSNGPSCNPLYNQPFRSLDYGANGIRIAGTPTEESRLQKALNGGFLLWLLPTPSIQASTRLSMKTQIASKRDPDPVLKTINVDALIHFKGVLGCKGLLDPKP